MESVSPPPPPPPPPAVLVEPADAEMKWASPPPAPPQQQQVEDEPVQAEPVQQVQVEDAKVDDSKTETNNQTPPQCATTDQYPTPENWSSNPNDGGLCVATPDTRGLQYLSLLPAPSVNQEELHSSQCGSTQIDEKETYYSAEATEEHPESDEQDTYWDDDEKQEAPQNDDK